ncbi:hypothetical protein DLAC_08898 [Tieghemostelium lacteum]|uniref:Methyltransferase domain-containing protein n=1 Tax=Tieghemostelium lacteum TaxID=361077 RepID=A0A151Z8M2_TIELA|nr:hypothetical protein DLAC_08898 [Tieghemostelium lacteum]|eukprot:KYQ90295.1 hypothetical protein DLAC_08898 [Tieghemostelium lacteum]
MTQNIYDNKEFFDEYAKLERSIKGIEGYREWPLLREQLGNVSGHRILDLGTGCGYFCRVAVEKLHAKEVVGVDVSELMLNRARELTNTELQSKIHYQQMDLENAQFNNINGRSEKFDSVFSVFVCHYIKNLETLFTRVFECMNSGAVFLFTVEHPIYTSTRDLDPDWIPLPSSTGDSNKIIWPLSNYNDEGERVSNWLVNGVIKQHRTIATYVNTLIKVGFRIEFMDEWFSIKSDMGGDNGPKAGPKILVIKVSKPGNHA